MENDKLKIDDKTARLIEEMDKSLHNMEKSLGPDHPVVSKILDSYATLLRQNNIRHLDAVNMEARAKHIRAKNNQEQEKAQAQGLEPLKEQKRMSMTQARLLTWCVSGIALIGFGFVTMDVLKASSKHVKAKKAEIKVLEEGTQVVPNSEVENPPPSPTAVSPTELPVAQTSTGPSAEQIAEAAIRNMRPPAGEQAPSQESVTVLQAGKRILDIKNYAREKVSEGMELERNKQFPLAAETYFTVIQNAQRASNEIGRPIYSEYIAKAFDGYGRMAELDNHPDIAQQSEKAAADIRSHLTESED